MLPVSIFSKVGAILLDIDLTISLGALGVAMDRFTKLQHKNEATKMMCRVQEAGFLSEWLRENFSSSDNRACAGQRDGTASLEFTSRLGEKVLFSHLLPLTKKHTENASFAIAFLLSFFEVGRENSIRHEIASAIFLDVASDLAQDLSYKYRHHPQASVHNTRSQRYNKVQRREAYM